jgi:cytochrome c oxidase assembly factor CtaG
LQTDPVPRRYSQLISLVISIVESIGDGLLGIVLWLGPLIAVDYYAQVGRHWGPSMRVDQSIGAGILWLVGDALGVPFIIVLMRMFSADEKVHADAVDAQLDNASEDFATTTGLWWENDPQLRDRMGRR